MSISFAHEGDWFVFDEQSGQTVERGFRSKDAASIWIIKRLRA